MHQEKAAGAARHSSIMFDSSTRGEERSPRHAMAKKDETIKDCVCVAEQAGSPLSKGKGQVLLTCVGLDYLKS